MRGWHEECGIIGVTGLPDASELAYYGLYALQHRGQEGAGIISFDGRRHHSKWGLGLVSDVFDRESLSSLPGLLAVGHNRYSTTGSSTKENLQPLLAHCRGGVIAIAHNGNLVNAWEVRLCLEEAGAIFHTSMDTEVVAHLVARSQRPTLEERLADALGHVSGAYSLLLTDGEKLIAARDPRGFRPLCIGRIGKAVIIASESCALDIVGAAYVREIEPGEVVVVRGEELRSLTLEEKPAASQCIFEYIYFSRPDSVVFGHTVDPIRRRLGRLLAEEHPADGDIVISVPDSSNSAALGFAERSGIPFEIGLIRNHYVGRTFIQPSQQLRDLRVRVKYNPVRNVLSGKRVVVVDDSIVRGTTMRKLIQMLRGAGAREVILRISSPPIRFPCFYGIDTPTRGELIASTHSVDEIGKYLGVDDVRYLSLAKLREAVPPAGGYCTACFDGEYPVPFGKVPSKEILEACGERNTPPSES